MIISVINHTNGKIADEDLLKAIRAINRQIAEDYEPYWSIGAELRLEGNIGKRSSTHSLADMRGDAVLYLWDKVAPDEALGYHDANHRGIPYGFVFTELSKALGESWTVTLSHEALEMIGDPEVNLLVAGPHPVEKQRTVFHWYEMCDAVQAETYKIDGVEVSNFLLPLYFTGGEEVGGGTTFWATVIRERPCSRSGSIPAATSDSSTPGRAKTRTSQGPKTGSPGDVWPSNAGDDRRAEASDINGFIRE